MPRKNGAGPCEARQRCGQRWQMEARLCSGRGKRRGFCCMNQGKQFSEEQSERPLQPEAYGQELSR